LNWLVEMGVKGGGGKGLDQHPALDQGKGERFTKSVPIKGGTPSGWQGESPLTFGQGKKASVKKREFTERGEKGEKTTKYASPATNLGRKNEAQVIKKNAGSQLLRGADVDCREREKPWKKKKNRAEGNQGPSRKGGVPFKVCTLKKKSFLMTGSP